MVARRAADIKRQSASSPRPRARQVPICANNHKVGVVIGDIFRKTVRGSKHQLRRPQAWAANLDSLHAASQAGARFIEIADKENGKVYRTSIARMLADGFPVSRGHGPQVALALHLWERPDLGEQLSFLAEQETNR